MRVLLLGHKGKLGRAFVRALPSESLHVHTGRVTVSSISSLIDDITLVKADVVINCISANGRKGESQSLLQETNVDIPLKLYSNLPKDIKYVQISSDYIYKTDDVSPYTKSKQMMDSRFVELMMSKVDTTNLSLVRVANLISEDDDDNLLYRVSKSEEPLKLTDTPVLPTDVDSIVPDILKIPLGIHNFYGQVKFLSDIASDLNITNYRIHTTENHIPLFLQDRKAFVKWFGDPNKVYNTLVHKYRKPLK